MQCPSCGSASDEGSEACLSCGRSLFFLTKGAVLNGRYEILGLLGKGGMGMVYRAQDRELEEVVALKVLRSEIAGSPEMAKRFRSEIKLARKVRHKNVCGIHEYGQQGHLRYIAMEYVEGTDLKTLLRTCGPMPAAEAFDAAIQVAAGLHAVHDVGIVHRDLKTPNIMRDAKGIVRLMDFGIAKSFEAEATGATATGQIIGTPEYMSPEQVKAERLDARSDIYSLGVVVFELFTGELPFRGDTTVATLMKHLQEPPPLEGAAAERLPAALIPVLAKGLAKARDERYVTAEEMGDALRAALQAATAGRFAADVPVGLELGPTRPLPVALAVSSAGPESLPPSGGGHMVAASAAAEPSTNVSATPVPTSVPTPVPTPVPTSVPSARSSPISAAVSTADSAQSPPPRSPAVAAAAPSVVAVARSFDQPPPLGKPDRGISGMSAAGIEAPLQPSPPAVLESPRGATASNPPAVVAPEQPRGVRPARATPRTQPIHWRTGAGAAAVLIASAVGWLLMVRDRAVEPPAPVTAASHRFAAGAQPLPSPVEVAPTPTAAAAGAGSSGGGQMPAGGPPRPSSRAADVPELRPRHQPLDPRLADPPSPVSATPVASKPTTAANLLTEPVPTPAPPGAPRPEPTSTPATPAGAEPPRPVAAPGKLVVRAKPWAQVTIDGRSVGRTPLSGVPLAAGAHQVVFEHPSYEPLKRLVRIQPGETATLSLDMRDEALKKRR